MADFDEDIAPDSAETPLFGDVSDGEPLAGNDELVDDGEETTGDETEYVDLLGQRIPRPTAENLLSFNQWAAQNPEKIQEFADYLEGRARIVRPGDEQPEQPAAQYEEEEEEVLNEEDLAELPEGVRTLLIQQQQQLRELREGYGSLASQSFQQRQAQAGAAIEVAAGNVAARFGLNAAQMAQVKADLAALGILPNIVAGAGGDLVRGTEEALELALYRNPSLRDGVMERRQKSVDDAQRRQRKAAKLAGGSGATPRQPSGPITRDQQVAAIAAEIREMRDQG